jgi:hypothetical protein
MINKARKWFVNSVFMLSFFGIAFFQACEDSVLDSNIPDEDIPESDISFQKYIQPIFTARCSQSSCHDDNSKAGNYSVTQWSNITQPGVVDPYNSSTSRLIWRIDPGFGFPIMPPISYGYLTDNQIRGIETWIDEGAQNN